MNSMATLYKIGKTKGLRERLDNYNTGNANDVEPEFILPVNDVDAVETCVKTYIKKFKYRKYKEVYEIDIELLKYLMEKCAEIDKIMGKHYERKKDETKKSFRE